MGSDADLETLKAKSEALSAASMKIGQAMYGKKDAESAADGEESKAEDAEFKEKEDIRGRSQEGRRQREKAVNTLCNCVCYLVAEIFCSALNVLCTVDRLLFSVIPL